MELKYYILILSIVVGIPLAVIMTKTIKSSIHIVFMTMIVSLVEPDKMGIMLVSRHAYRTITRGIGFSVADFCAIVLFLALLLRRKEYSIRWNPPMILSYGIFLLFAFVSWFMVGGAQPIPEDFYRMSYPLKNSYFEVGLYPAFEITKVIRGILVLWVTINYLSLKENFKFLKYSFLIAVFYTTVSALIERYIMGSYRVGGSMDHANGLATYILMLSVPVFGISLMTKKSFEKILYLIATLCCLVTMILTVSRGGLAFLLVTMVLTTLSLYWSSGKLYNSIIILVACAFMTVVVFKSYDTLKVRFQKSTLVDYSIREEHNIEAKQMASDTFWGVGMGNFSAMSWVKYAFLNPNRREYPGTPAHNLWYLTLAELGYPGLLAMILIWLRLSSIFIMSLFKKLHRENYAWLMIAAIALFGMHLQESLNNSYRFLPIYMTIQIFTGVIVAIYCQGKSKEKERGVESV